MITLFGVLALTFMMTMYAPGGSRTHLRAYVRGRVRLSSTYGFLAGAWPFGVVELVWAIVALRRWGERSTLHRRHP